MFKDVVVSYKALNARGLVDAALSGELDLDSADRVRDGLAQAALTPGCRHLRVDVAMLGFIDSYGLGALVSARNSAAGAGVILTLVNPSPPVLRAIRVTGLGAVFGLSAD